MAKFVIINADDYGLTTAVSKGIRRAHLDGVLTSTTVMPTGLSVNEDLKLLMQECPRIGLGIHLTLTNLKPVCKVRFIKSLITKSGTFYSLNDHLSQEVKIDVSELYLEWKSQIEFILSFGVEIDHLDSHHFSSYFSPETLEVTLKLCEEYKLPTRTPFSLIKNADYLNESHKLLSQKRVKFPDTLFVQLTENRGSEQTLIEILRTVENGISEIVTHPGNYDDELKSISSYVEHRQTELYSLMSKVVRSVVDDSNICLSTYKILPR